MTKKARSRLVGISAFIAMLLAIYLTKNAEELIIYGAVIIALSMVGQYLIRKGPEQGN